MRKGRRSQSSTLKPGDRWRVKSWADDDPDSRQSRFRAVDVEDVYRGLVLHKRLAHGGGRPGWTVSHLASHLLVYNGPDIENAKIFLKRAGDIGLGLIPHSDKTKLRKIHAAIIQLQRVCGDFRYGGT